MKTRTTTRKRLPDVRDATRPKAERPETKNQAMYWEQVNRLAHDVGGLCWRCSAQLAWGHQIGFARVEREPCDTCRPLVAALPKPTSHPAWRTVTGDAGRMAAWAGRTPAP